VNGLMTNLLKCTIAAIGISSIGFTLVNAQQISTVRKAAIERMQTKLGSIRGSLNPGSRNVYLTEKMIEQLKPIRTTPVVAEQFPAQPAQDAELSIVDLGRTKTSTELAREIYRSVGLVADQELENNKRAATMPNSSDIDSIMRAVDRMIADGE